MTRLRDTPPRHSVDQNPTFFYVEKTIRRKISREKNEIPPRACRPLKKLNKNKVQEVYHQKVKKQNYVEKVDPKKVATKTMSNKWVQKVEKKHCRKSGPPKS